MAQALLWQVMRITLRRETCGVRVVPKFLEIRNASTRLDEHFRVNAIFPGEDTKLIQPLQAVTDIRCAIPEFERQDISASAGQLHAV
ncbi:hypothetical protein A9R05_43940 (plasmid) [Burkholderia sp. KK1]|nr:hypothetical protein A9R05_43940 [Burkholderia sp. KK1]